MFVEHHFSAVIWPIALVTGALRGYASSGGAILLGHGERHVCHLIPPLSLTDDTALATVRNHWIDSFVRIVFPWYVAQFKLVLWPFDVFLS